MNVLHVNTTDVGGGAEVITMRLHEKTRSRGHQSRVAVGLKRGHDPDVFELEHDRYRNGWARTCIGMAEILKPLRGKFRGSYRMYHWLQMGIGQPHRYRAILRGDEDFDFPGTWRIFEHAPKHPDVLHLHNLHGNYFDLRALPWLSDRVPVFVTLHDSWMLTGHCAHSFSCDRWKDQCGECPDLNSFPSVLKDNTSYNWKLKAEIYERSRLRVASPSRWMMNRIEQSIIQRGISETRIIPNGVDLSIFSPGDKFAIRDMLHIPRDAKVLIFAAQNARRNSFKDFQMIRVALKAVAARITDVPLVFIALGQDAPTEREENLELRSIRFEKEPTLVAQYYQAADLYLHAAKAETFGLAITEAMACRTPVVATAVGGILDQIDDGVNGLLVPPADSEQMARAIIAVLESPTLHRKLAWSAGCTAREKFGLDRMVDRYLSWYSEGLEATKKTCSASSRANTEKALN